MVPLLLLAALGCDADFVLLSGRLVSEDDDASPIEGASITAWDYGQVLTDEVTTGADGAFSASVRAGSIFFFSLEAEGHVPTGVTGTVGHFDYAMAEGEHIWMRSDGAMETIRQEFAGCPGADGGAVIEGIVRLYIPDYEGEYEAEDLPVSNTGWAVAWDNDGNSYDACYLLDDEEQVVYDPDATVTGYHGRFAIFDAPAGPLTLEVGYDLEGEPYYSTYYAIYLPGGGTAPLYPAWVEL
jgi:hypothetical protein